MPTTFTHPDLSALSVVDALRSSGFEVDAAAPSTRTVLDTFDGRLHDAGLRLEQRQGVDASLVLLDQRGAPPARLVAGKAVPRWPADLPSGPFRARLASVTEERALLPLLTVTSQVQRTRRVDRRGKVTVRGELHERVTVDGEELPGWFVELSGVAGHDDDRERVITRLATLGLEPVDGDLVATVAERTGHQLEGRSSSPTVPLDPHDGALTAFRCVLANLAATIDHNLQGTIDDVDVEFLHELRVAVRRTRSVLAQGKGVLPADIRDRYRQDFGWLGEVTGPARDLDVYVLGWDDYVGPLALDDPRSLDRVLAELEARRLAAHAELADVLRSDRCRGVLDSWQRWLVDPDVVGETDAPIGPVVAKRIAKAQDKVLTDGRSITPASPPERLHDLRKDTKKLRYLLECFGSLFATKPRKAFVNQLKALQDNLGEHQDAEVHLAELRDLAHDLHARATVDTDALLAMGRLSDHLDRRRARERADFVERFAAYDTKANRRILADLLAEVADA